MKVYKFYQFHDYRFKLILNEIHNLNLVNTIKPGKKQQSSRNDNISIIVDYFICDHQNVKHMFIIYENNDYNLVDIINRRKQEQDLDWSDSQVLGIAQDLIQALKQIHEQKVCVRNLRLENIYYNQFRNKYEISNFAQSLLVVTDLNQNYKEGKY